MLLKFDKRAFWLTIIGLISLISFHLLKLFDETRVIVQILGVDGDDFLCSDSSLPEITLLIFVIISIIFIIKPARATAILAIIVSVPVANVFLFIAAIMVLVKIREVNQEKEKKAVAELEAFQENIMTKSIDSFNEKIDNLENVSLEEKEILKKIQEYKKQDIIEQEIKKNSVTEFTRIEFIQPEKKEIAWGIVISSTHILSYGTALYFIYRVLIPFYYSSLNFVGWVDSMGPGGAFLALYLFLPWLAFILVFAVFLASLLIPIIFFILNIIFSVIALNRKTIRSMRKMKKYGYLGLTFINSFAAKCVLYRYSY